MEVYGRDLFYPQFVGRGGSSQSFRSGWERLATPRVRIDARRAYAGNSILGNLSTDGIRIFAVDSLDIRPRHSVLAVDELTGGRMGWDERMARNANRLVAFNLFASQGNYEGSVKPAWSIGGSMGTSNWFYRMDSNDDGRVTQAEFLGSPDEFPRSIGTAMGQSKRPRPIAQSRSPSIRCTVISFWDRRWRSTVGSTPSPNRTAN